MPWSHALSKRVSIALSMLTLLQRDGYFYVTQGEKSLANQTHAGGQRRARVCSFARLTVDTRHNEGNGIQRC